MVVRLLRCENRSSQLGCDTTKDLLHRYHIHYIRGGGQRRCGVGVSVELLSEVSGAVERDGRGGR